MLVLTRKINQSIMIGSDIEVSVISVAGDKVRLGIQAPRDVAVFRREVFDEIQLQNQAAAESLPAAVDQALGALDDASTDVTAEVFDAAIDEAQGGPPPAGT